MKTFQNFYPYSELQWTVEGQNYSFNVTGQWEKSLCKQRSGSNCRWNALLRNKKGQQGKKRTVSRHCLCALCVDSVGSWSGLCGLLERTLWAPGADSVGSWSGLCGLLERTLWAPGADSVGSWSGGALERATWPFQRNYILHEVRIAKQSKANICVYKAYTFYFIFFKWPFVLLDKTLIHRLVTETLISFRLKKEIHKHIWWYGGV